MSTAKQYPGKKWSALFQPLQQDLSICCGLFKMLLLEVLKAAHFGCLGQRGRGGRRVQFEGWIKTLSFSYQIRVPTILLDKYTPDSNPTNRNLMNWPYIRGNTIKSATGVSAGRGLHRDIFALTNVIFSTPKIFFFADATHEEREENPTTDSDRKTLLMPKKGKTLRSKQLVMTGSL